MPLMTMLQKIANHLDLVKADRKVKQESDYVRDHAFAEIALGPDAEEEVGGYDVGQSSFIASSNNMLSGKLGVLNWFLEKWEREGEKCLIFTQQVRMLDLIADFMVRKGYEHLKLDGRVNQKDRQGLVDKFNNSPRILAFVISTRVGGLGLNLTGASRVIIFDPMWNPSFDAQSQDRAYRLGQKKFVEVYRLLSKGSIEESIYKRQVYKQQQSKVAMHDTKERRLFEGTNKHNLEDHGELFGVENLFKMPEEFKGMHELLGDCEKMEDEFADEAELDIEIVKYVPPVVDEDGDERLAAGDDYGLGAVINEMTDVANSAPEKKKKKKKKQTGELTVALDSQDGSQSDAAHLRSLGVESIHDNAKIQGESEVEKLISKRAKIVAPPVEPAQMPTPPRRDADYATFGNMAPPRKLKKVGDLGGPSHVQAHAACECVAAALATEAPCGKDPVAEGYVTAEGTVTDAGFAYAADMIANTLDEDDLVEMMAEAGSKTMTGARRRWELMPDDVKHFEPPKKKAKRKASVKKEVKKEVKEENLDAGAEEDKDSDDDWH